MTTLLTQETLRKENAVFAGTRGVSQGNRSEGFRPGFCDLATGQTALARFADGRPAPMHLLEGLPASWVVERDTGGGICAIKETVIAGFLRDGLFYTREQAAAAVSH